MDLASIDNIEDLSKEDFQDLMQKAVDLQREDRNENQILYYHPASPQAMRIHKSK